MPDYYCTIINKKIHIWLTTLCNVSNSPYACKAVRSWGPVQFPEWVQQKAEAILQTIANSGFDNTFCNLQFIAHDDKLYPLDLNCRISHIWTHVHKVMCPDFFIESIKAFLGQPWQLTYKHNCFVRLPYTLDGDRVIEQIEIPDFDKNSIVITHQKKLRNHYQVPSEQTSVGPHPQIFAAGDTFENCEQKIFNIIKNTKVSYLDS